MALREANTELGLTGKTDAFLRASIGFLSTGEVAKKVPHAALPIEWSELLLSFAIQGQLEKHARSYEAKFGAPDQLGKGSIFSSKDRGDTATIIWGNGVAELTIDRKLDQVTLKTNVSPVSIELMTDILVALLRDPYTAERHPNFSVPYLRRWGEDAFYVTALKPGVPKLLTAKTPLIDTNEGVVEMVANTRPLMPEVKRSRGRKRTVDSPVNKDVQTSGVEVVPEVVKPPSKKSEELTAQAAKLEKQARRLASTKKWLDVKKRILAQDDELLDADWQNLQAREEQVEGREAAFIKIQDEVAQRAKELQTQADRMDVTLARIQEEGIKNEAILREANEKLKQVENLRQEIQADLKAKFSLE